MNNVADQPDLGLEQLLLLGSLGKQFLLLRLNVGWDISARRAIQIDPVPPTFLLQEIGDILLGLHNSVRIGCSADEQQRMPSSWGRSASGPR